jgi:hypothetical protein
VPTDTVRRWPLLQRMRLLRLQSCVVLCVALLLLAVAVRREASEAGVCEAVM